MQLFARLVGAVGAVALVGSLAGCAPPGSFDRQIVSRNAQSGDSSFPVASPDGTKIAFVTSATNLGPTDTNGVEDVYVRDLTAGTTRLVSANAKGTDGGNQGSGAPVWSPDGTMLAFATAASDLGPNDTNGTLDVYVRDLTSDTTRLVSANAAGTDGGDDSSFRPVFDPGSRRIAFESVASDLGATDTNGATDVYLRDLTTNRTTLVSAAAAAGVGNRAGNGFSVGPAFSPDGGTVAFTSGASDLGALDANGATDVYARDLAAGRTRLLSAGADGASADGESRGPVFGPDGAQVAFMSAAGNLGPRDTNGQFDVYLQDVRTRTNQLVSVNAGGTDASDGTSGPFATFVFPPEFSPDGNRILFASSGTDLVPGDRNGLPDLFVRDLAKRTTSAVTVDPSGTATVGLSFDSAEGSPADLTGDPAFDHTGTRVVFVSAESGFGPRDTNRSNDVYLRDLVAGTTRLVSDDADHGDTNGAASGQPVFLTGSQVRIAFTSFASNFGQSDLDQAGLDIYLATRNP